MLSIVMGRRLSEGRSSCTTTKGTNLHCAGLAVLRKEHGARSCMRRTVEPPSIVAKEQNCRGLEVEMLGV